METKIERFRELTRRILGGAIEVHRALGPGLLESSYRICLVRQLELDGLAVRHEVPIEIIYKDFRIATAYRADLVVEDIALVELKAVEKLLPVHEAQILTYLKHASLPVGLLLNFNMPTLRDGIRRFIRY
jgi:GxxExxY protein